MGLAELQLIRQKRETIVPKKQYTIKKVSDRRANRIKQNQENGTDQGMDKFFLAMRKKCKGKCLFCNSATTYKDEERWRIAIAHLLPKSKFISIATNEFNWIELCWDCHRKFDDGFISWQCVHDSKEWETIKEKLFEVLPLVDDEEKKNKLYSKLIELVYGEVKKASKKEALEVRFG